MKVLLGFVGLAAAARLEANPIRRIVTLIQNMQKEVQEEGRAEQKLFDKFMCYCSSNDSNLGSDINTAIESITQFKSDIDAKTARKATLDGELDEHKNDRSDAKKAIAKATSIRNNEAAQFAQESGDQTSYINALRDAIPAIEKGMGASLMQIPSTIRNLQRALDRSVTVTASEKDSVMSFLSTKNPYGNHQSSADEIVGILKQMKDDIDKDLGGIVSIEDAAVKNYNELVAAKKTEIKAASEAIEDKQVRAGELAVAITEDKNSKRNAEKQLTADQQFQANLKSNCATKEQEQNQRVKTRNEELVAISEAIKILNDDDSLEIFKKTLPSPGAPAFLQERSIGKRSAEAYAWIQTAARTSEDRHTQLNLLAFMLRVGKVDFNKVLVMIDNMITHLGKEQKNDDHELSWCNNELEESDDKKKVLQRGILRVSNQVDEGADKISELSANMESFSNKIAETDMAVAEATEQRKKEHAEFVQTSAELNAAGQLLEKAKNRLNQFYNPKLYSPPPARELTEEERIAQNMGEVLPTEEPTMIAGTNIAVSLLQTADQPAAAPSTWSAGGYQKKGQKSGGVIALMEMLIKDVGTQMHEGKLDEENSQKNYERIMSDASGAREEDSRALASTKADQANTSVRFQDDKSERRALNDQLGNNNKYISELHGQCDFLQSNFDFRKEARAHEADSLKNAKAVLSGASYGQA